MSGLVIKQSWLSDLGAYQSRGSCLGFSDQDDRDRSSCVLRSLLSLPLSSILQVSAILEYTDTSYSRPRENFEDWKMTIYGHIGFNWTQRSCSCPLDWFILTFSISLPTHLTSSSRTNSNINILPPNHPIILHIRNVVQNIISRSSLGALDDSLHIFQFEAKDPQTHTKEHCSLLVWVKILMFTEFRPLMPSLLPNNIRPLSFVRLGVT
jgi:hypothetical protein